jgi:hypothetical protein
MTEEYLKILEKAIMGQSRYYPSICLERLRKKGKTSIRIADVLAEVGTTDVPITNLEHYL